MAEIAFVFVVSLISGFVGGVVGTALILAILCAARTARDGAAEPQVPLGLDGWRN